MEAEISNSPMNEECISENSSFDWLTRFENGFLIGTIGPFLQRCLGEGQPTTAGGLTEFLCQEFQSVNNALEGVFKTKV